MARITRMDSTKTGKRLGTVCFAIFVLAACCFGQAANSGPHSGDRRTTHIFTDWNQFHRHDMTRYNPYEKFFTVNNVTNLTLKWSYPTSSQVWSSPAVADGLVYVGSADCSVYAVDADTGAKLWSYQTTAAVFSSPAVADGVVYVGSDDYNVYALDAHTGAKL